MPDTYWDIALAEQWTTTPWDVREHATLDDIKRISKWSSAKNAAMKIEEQKSKAKQATSRRPAPRRRR